MILLERLLPSIALLSHPSEHVERRPLAKCARHLRHSRPRRADALGNLLGKIHHQRREQRAPFLHNFLFGQGLPVKVCHLDITKHIDLHKKVIVLDVGINRIDDESRERGWRLAGDVHPDVSGVASWLSPVPGGVGPMTIAMLMENTVRAAELTIQA